MTERLTEGRAGGEAFACGQCDAVHADREGAEKCGRCRVGDQLREARKALRRAVEDEARARKRLDELLAMKRPAAGSAPV